MRKALKSVHSGNEGIYPQNNNSPVLLGYCCKYHINTLNKKQPLIQLYTIIVHPIFAGIDTSQT